MWIAQVLLYLVHYVEEKIETFAPSLSFIYTVVNVQIIWSFFDTDGQLFTRGVWWAIFFQFRTSLSPQWPAWICLHFGGFFRQLLGNFHAQSLVDFFVLFFAYFKFSLVLKEFNIEQERLIFSVQDLKRSEFWAPLATLIVSCLEADIAGKPIEARNRTNVAGGGGGRVG